MIASFRGGLCALLVLFLGCPVVGVSASDLGSPAETRAALSDDYPQLVERAFPTFDRARLAARVEGIARKYPQGLDTLKVRSLKDVERLMKLKTREYAPTSKVFRGEGLAYEVHPEKGKILFSREVRKPMALTREEGVKRRVDFVRRHEALLERIGVPKEQIFFEETSLLMAQSSTNPKKGPVRKTKPVVEGFTTVALRAVDGILVEGSVAKVTSFSAEEVNALTVDWPRVQLHPAIKSFELRNQGDMKKAIADRVRAIAGKGKANVRMAVVLLPVQEGETSYLVPVMKVGVHTAQAGEGVVFYENLLKEGVEIEKPQSDEASGGPQGPEVIRR